MPEVNDEVVGCRAATVELAIFYFCVYMLKKEKQKKILPDVNDDVVGCRVVLAAAVVEEIFCTDTQANVTTLALKYISISITCLRMYESYVCMYVCMYV